MLLLLLFSLLSNYNLFYCNQKGQPTLTKQPLTALIHKSIRDIDELLQNFQKEIQKEKSMLRSVDFDKSIKEDMGLFDYNVTPLWWKNNTSGNTTVEDNSTHSTFLMLEAVPEGLWANLSLSTVSNVPSRFTTPSPLYDSDEIFYKDFTSNNPFPSLSFWPEAVKTIPNYTALLPSFSPGASRTTTLNPVTTVNLDYWPFWTTTEVYPSALRGSPSAIVKSSPKMSTTLRTQNFKLMRNLTGVSPSDLRVKLNQATPKPRKPSTTLSKAQAWVRNRQWTTTTRPGTSPLNSTARLLRDLAQRQGDTMSTQTAFTEELFHTNAHGFLYVSVPDVVVTTPYIEPTVAGDVLYSADAFTATTEGGFLEVPYKEYHELMNKTDEGYIMVFLIEFTRIVAEKDDKLVMEVLQHSEAIINDYVSKDRLVFAGSRITQVFMYFGKLMTDSVFNRDFLHSYALMMHMMLTERFTSLSAEINALIDYSDMLFDDKFGEALLEVLGQFEDYPNHTTSKTAPELCFDLLEHVVDPFRAISDTERGQRLIDSVHQALTDRWDSLNGDYRKWRGTLIKMSEKAIPKANLSRAFYKNTTLSLKRRISMKRRQLNLTQQVTNGHRRQYDQTPWHLMIRSMLPITRRQTRFKVITPRSSRNTLFTNIERPTQGNYRRRLGRPSYSAGGMMQFFPQMPVEMKKAQHIKKAGSRRRKKKTKKKKKISPKVDVQ